MFSRNFVNTLNSSLTAIQQDRVAAQSPAIKSLAGVLHALSREIDRIDRVMTITDHEVSLKMGNGSVVIRANGSITINSSSRIAIITTKDIVLDGLQVIQ